MRKAKTYSGGAPDAEEWPMVGEVQADGATWGVWMKAPNAAGWCMVKVAALGEVKRKANFWTSWSGERFAMSRDLQAMQEHRPALYSAIMGMERFTPTHA